MINLTPETIENLKARIQSNQLTKTDYDLFGNLLNFNLWLQFELEESKLSTHRLQKLFGFTPNKKKKSAEAPESQDSNHQDIEASGESHSNKKTKKRKGHGQFG